MIQNFSINLDKNTEKAKKIKKIKFQNLLIMICYIIVVMSAIIVTFGYAMSSGGVYSLLLIAEFLIFGGIFAIISRLLINRLDFGKGDEYRTINESVMHILQQARFEINKTFSFSVKKSGNTDMEKMLVFVDGKNQKFAFIDYNKKSCSIVDFKDLVSYKIIENNGSEIESSTGYSLFFDSLYTKVSSVDVCKNLKLVFVLNDEENATVVYELNKTSLSIKNTRYKNLSQELINLTAFIDIVQNKIPKDKKFIYCRHCGVKNAYDQTHCSACGSVLN